MWEIYLISALTGMVILLLYLVLKRQKELRGAIHLGEELVNELLSAVVNNARAGRISEIADHVTEVLRFHLKCDRIVFLINNRGVLELRHFFGLENPDFAAFRFSLDSDKLNMFKAHSQVAIITQFERIVGEEKFHDIAGLGFRYFFAVKIGNRLAGVYLLKSSLAYDNPSLLLLTSALAYSLSAADHIRQQDKRIRKIESKLQAANLYENLDGEIKAGVRPELLRLLKIKNSKKLISELVKTVGKEANLTKLALFTGDGAAEDAIFTMNWNVKGETDRVLRDFLLDINDRPEQNVIVDLNKLAATSSGEARGKIDKLIEQKIRFVASVPWVENRKALLAWDTDEIPEQLSGSLLEFWNNALPLVENLNRFERAQEMSYTDGLTGLYNFRYFQKRMMEEFLRAHRYGHSLSLLIFDLDNLKEVNDNYGHVTGDHLLIAFARVLSESVRAVDVICRYGGDEFCMILPETSRARALLLMDRIQRNIARNPLSIEKKGLTIAYTASIGGAVFPVDAKNVEELIKAADSALLRAKEEGRNCSRLFEASLANEARAME